MKLTLHFDAAEFGRPARRGLAAAPYPPKWIEERLLPLCRWLEKLRTGLGGKSIKVISGYRDPKYNAAIGGARASQHMQGRAADIVVAGVSPARVHEVALKLHGEGDQLGGLGRYDGFTHIDLRPGDRIARWTGSRTAKATSG